MTAISAASRRQPRALTAALLAMLALCLFVCLQVTAARAQKSYRYEDDPIRAGSKALEENKLDVEKSFAEAHAGLGIILIDADKWPEGTEHIMEARKQNGGYWPGIYGEARVLIHDKKYDK